MRQETKADFLFGTVILGFLSIFKKCQASSHFEALYSVCRSVYKSDVISPIQMRRRTTALSRASTGDSDIPSSCEMKHEPEFKPLQGNRAFFESGSLVVHSTWNREHRALSHTYYWGKTPLEVLVESWLKSSIKHRESALNLEWYGVHGAFLELLYWY